MTDPLSPAPSLLQDQPADLATVRREDSRRVVEAMEQWRRRSRLIHFFRRALPVAIGLVILGVVGWVVARTVLTDMADRAASRSEVRMTNPRFYGQDSRGRAFVLGAAEAVQDRARRQIINLTRPTLRLDATGERPTEITSQDGVYDEGDRRVSLTGQVLVIDGASGFRFQTDEALIDTETGVISGERPISGRGPLGTIDAASYAIYDQGARLVFEGSGDNKVRALINTRD